MGQIVLTDGSPEAMIDSWMDEDNPTANYGTDTTFITGVVGTKGGDKKAHFCLNCPATDVKTGLPGDATITSVILRLWIQNAASGAQSAILSRLTQTWAESGTDYVSWDKRNFGTSWSTPGGTFTTDNEVPYNLSLSGGVWQEITITDLFTDARTAGVDLRLVSRIEVAVGGSRSITVHSGENGSNKPEVVINYTQPGGGPTADPGDHRLPGYYGTQDADHRWNVDTDQDHRRSPKEWGLFGGPLGIDGTIYTL